MIVLKCEILYVKCAQITRFSIRKFAFLIILKTNHGYNHINIYMKKIDNTPMNNCTNFVEEILTWGRVIDKIRIFYYIKGDFWNEV